MSEPLDKFMFRLAVAHPWLARWLLEGEVIIQSGKGVTATQNMQTSVPRDIQALGCTGTAAGRTHWVGWDLDVGAHGVVSYPNLNAAIHAGRRLCRELEGYRELRLSKSGNGVHVRQQFNEPKQWFSVGQYAKDMAKAYDILGDRGPLGRQQFFLWTRNPGPRSFELIAEYDGDSRA